MLDADVSTAPSQGRAARIDVDREDGLARRSARAGLRVDELCDLSLRGLRKMHAGDGKFVQTMRGIGDGRGRMVRPEGDNLRYAAITALGLSRVPEHEQHLVLDGDNAADLARRSAARAIESNDLGAIALSAWAAAEVGNIHAADLLERLAMQLAGNRPVETVVCAWALTAALAARQVGDTAELIATAAARLRAGQAASGLFPRLLPAETGGWARAHVGCFADQVYPIQALARLAVATDDRGALAAADRCAFAICEAQGVAGQWWWHYDARAGGVVEGYPVYSVHQHAMAPMALLDLWEAGGRDHWWPVIRGLSWIDSHPEAGAELVDEREALVWRKIGRREPRKAVRSVSAITTGLRSGWHLPGLDRLFPPNRIDYECRPYEFGWLLYAWRSAGVVKALQQKTDGSDA